MLRVLLLMLVAGLSVQSAAPPRNGEGGRGFLLAEGRPVKLRFAQDVKVKDVVEGDVIQFVLEENLAVDEVVVAKAGAKAYGEVLRAKKVGLLSKGEGELTFRVNYLVASGNNVKLRMQPSRALAGVEGAAGVVTPRTGGDGVRRSGRNLEVLQGAELTVYVAEEIRLPPTETN